MHLKNNKENKCINHIVIFPFHDRIIFKNIYFCVYNDNNLNNETNCC